MYEPRTGLAVAVFSLLCCLLDGVGAGGTGLSVPRIEGEYVHVYKPAGDTFEGPDVAGLKAGEFYEEWVANDHCFARDGSGRWHAFGITHPTTGVQEVHAGEWQSFHAVAPEGNLRNVLRTLSWKDRPKVLPPSERPGEIRENHAPCIVKQDDRFVMIYGPTPLRHATSRDLMAWIPRGALANAPPGRDPNILFWNGTYYLVVCGQHSVDMATSKDLETWERQGSVLQMKGGVDPESPTLIRYNDTFYLFVCGWNGIWDRKDLQGAYQHVTYVYQSDDPFHFDANREVTRLDAHAPEIFQDETGSWFISSVEWPHRGVSLAILGWKKSAPAGESKQ